MTNYEKCPICKRRLVIIPKPRYNKFFCENCLKIFSSTELAKQFLEIRKVEQNYCLTCNKPLRTLKHCHRNLNVFPSILYFCSREHHLEWITKFQRLNEDN